jgi:hypothetical protein
MKDFKKMPKMACGGGVQKYNEGKSVDSNSIEYWANKRSPESKAAAEQRMTEYTEGKAKSSAQFKENMGNISKDYDTKISDLKAKYQPSRVGGGGGGGGGSGPKNLIDSDSPLNRKKGGAVRRNKK